MSSEQGLKVLREGLGATVEKMVKRSDELQDLLFSPMIDEVLHPAARVESRAIALYGVMHSVLRKWTSRESRPGDFWALAFALNIDFRQDWNPEIDQFLLPATNTTRRREIAQGEVEDVNFMPVESIQGKDRARSRDAEGRAWKTIKARLMQVDDIPTELVDWGQSIRPLLDYPQTSAEQKSAEYTDVDVRVAFGELVDNHALRVRFITDANVTQSRLLFAVTSRTSTAEALCETFPELTDVFVPADDEHLADVVASVWLLDRNGDRPVTVEAVEVEHPMGEEVVWLEASFNGDSSEKRVRYISDQIVSLADRYVYWSAPRRCQLQTVVLDLSGFPDWKQFHFFVHPNLGRYAPLTEDLVSGLISIYIDDVIDSGHGFHLRWKPKE